VRTAATDPNAVANADAAVPSSLSKAAADFGARDMLLALRSLSKNLNTVPGRKTLILFTGGFPLNSERISEITAAIDTCNKSNVAVYPIDVRGLIAGTPLAELGSPSPSPLRNAQAGLARAFGALLQPVAFTSGSLMSPGMSFFQRGGGAPGGGGGGAGGGGGGGGGTGGRTGGGAAGGGAPGGAAPGGGAPGGGTTGGRTGSPTPGTGNTGTPNTGRGGAPNPNYNPNNLNNMNNMNGLGPASNARNILIPKMPDSGIDNQTVMQMLADGTGGFVIKNTNDLFAGLQKIG
jgi:hypothetical protein